MKPFRNALIYRWQAPDTWNEETLDAALAQHPFVPCSRHEQHRHGWIAPVSFSEECVFAKQGAQLISFLEEDKVVPAAALRDEVEQRVAVIEDSEARKVYRKEREQIKDEVMLEFLPRAFSRRKVTRALLLAQEGWILIDAGSFKVAERLLNALREALGSLLVRPLAVNQAPASVMTQWLLDLNSQAPGFELEDECELRDTGEEAGIIRIKGQELMREEIQAHLQQGMQATRLALVWQEQLRFLLHADLSLHRFKLTDQYAEQQDQERSDDEQADAETQLVQMSLEFKRLLPQLIECFGGEVSL
ncbi:recombination-associated protein RdgC [Nitrincola tapanii]|uniref:Recombination-associated protein RdgC n=1 Tax=Nitrincola tapanii TaxID=1708751 RepID=A0A5A9W4W0_9GAMM|nr:recombination-associated protein RdgC [Nitrincola tapanii]KAA0875806.1 recombination-associated protein RdgC [Nitrincola tapanii]